MFKGDCIKLKTKCSEGHYFQFLLGEGGSLFSAAYGYKSSVAAINQCNEPQLCPALSISILSFDSYLSGRNEKCKTSAQ